MGRGPPQDEGRLLYMGQNEWTHVNCALWSAEVFEEGDGTLRNVHAAVARGRQMVRRGLKGGDLGFWGGPRCLWGSGGGTLGCWGGLPIFWGAPVGAGER